MIAHEDDIAASFRAQLPNDGDSGTSCFVDAASLRCLIDHISRLETALENIAIEAERPNGHWVHLKRVIGINARAALRSGDHLGK